MFVPFQYTTHLGSQPRTTMRTDRESTMYELALSCSHGSNFASDLNFSFLSRLKSKMDRGICVISMSVGERKPKTKSTTQK